MKTEIVQIDTPELQLIEKSKAEQIKSTFEPMAAMLTEFEAAYNEILSEAQKEITQDVTQKAKRLRLDIGKVRIETGKKKDKAKEYLKLEDRAIMGVHNILVYAVKEKEDKLKEIENHFEILEQKRLEQLQKQRVERLSKYVEDAHERDLSKFAEDEFEALYEMKKRQYEDKIAAEKKAEEERIAREKIENIHNSRKEELLQYWQFVPDLYRTSNLGLISNKEFESLLKDVKNSEKEYQLEQERQRKENERLKKEAEERERIAKIEAEKRAKEEQKRQAKIEAEQKAREEKERKERELYEAKLKAEREEKERIQKELEAKADAEREAKEKEEARLQEELNKGDKEKVQDLINDLKALKTKYSFKSDKNQDMYITFGIRIDEVIGYIER